MYFFRITDIFLLEKITHMTVVGKYSYMKDKYRLNINNIHINESFQVVKTLQAYCFRICVVFSFYFAWFNYDFVVSELFLLVFFFRIWFFF